MCPEYSRKQLDQAFRRTVRPQYSERMTDRFAVQAMTTKRTTIYMCGVMRRVLPFQLIYLSF